MYTDEHKWQTSWTEEQVQDFLRTETFSYQRIELPYGLSTRGQDRSWTCRKIFPDDMTGKTVLDIGSQHGYFCFEALKRGARKAVGIDVDPEYIRKARLLAECLGIPAEFHLLDIEDEEFTDTFDYVLCLNVLHHLKNPLSVLEKLIKRTRERLVLEVAALGRHDRRKLRLSLWHGFMLNRLPVLYVGENGIAGRSSGQKFFLSRSALENLLLQHRKVFSHIAVFDSELKNRYIAISYKRRIERLVVIAGPTAVGKSTLIKKMRRSEVPEIAEKLRLGNISSWQICGARNIDKLKQPQQERLIFHYDFLRPVKRDIKNYRKDEALDLFEVAEDMIFLTLWVKPQQVTGTVRKEYHAHSP